MSAGHMLSDHARGNEPVPSGGTGDTSANSAQTSCSWQAACDRPL